MSAHMPGVGRGTHVWHEDVDEPFVQATYIDQGCGCRIVGSGTLRHPLTIQRCGTHSAASEMLKTLRDMDRWLANTGHDADHPWRISVNAAIAKVEGQS